MRVPAGSFKGRQDASCFGQLLRARRERLVHAIDLGWVNAQFAAESTAPGRVLDVSGHAVEGRSQTGAA